MIKDTEDFIEKSIKVHGDFFNYSQSVFIDTGTEINIICPNHSLSKQLPNDHIISNGCPNCIRRDKLNIESFIIKANIIHNDKYDYSLSVYKNYHSDALIICPIHKKFEQKVCKHLNKYGYGCQECGKDNSFKNHRRITVEEFIRRARAVHGDKYGYELIDEIRGNRDIVKIICPIHGIFEQSVSKHFIYGCRQCGYIVRAGKQRFNLETFIKQAQAIHGDRYDYQHVNYKNARIPVDILCKLHGIFKQAPFSHTKGAGCPNCFHNISKPETEWLDSLDIKIRNKVIKVGSKIIKADGFDPITNTIYEFNGDYWHGNPNKYNLNDLNQRNNKTFGELYQATLTKEKLIKEGGYNLISIWEEDYYNSKK